VLIHIVQWKASGYHELLSKSVEVYDTLNANAEQVTKLEELTKNRPTLNYSFNTELVESLLQGLMLQYLQMWHSLHSRM